MNEEEAVALDPAWLEEETARQQEEAKRRIALYRGGRTPLAPTAKTVGLVDDGIATGLTMRLAVRSAKARGATKIIVAVPVAPEDSVTTLKADGANEVIVIESPKNFLGAVGAHYVRFEQVSDAEVVRLLEYSQV